MELRLHEFELPLRHVFAISREAFQVQRTLIVELSEDGFCGYGEATTNPYYGVTIETLKASLEAVRPQIEAATVEDPPLLWQQLAPVLSSDPFAQCAVDEAAYDLWGKQRGAPVHALWGLDVTRIPASNFTIGIDSIERMVSKLKEMPDWPIYKIKLGTPHDLEIVRTLREQTDAVFRVDANCGWTPAETLRNAEELAELNVEFIEQPLPAGDSEASRIVYQESALPIIADESCIVESDVAHCTHRFHGINIKLVKCGGLTPARRMIDEARTLGLRVMVGCMTESTVGISAIAQLLPLLDYVDMDGAALLARDVASGVRVENGICRYPQENGTGAQLLECFSPDEASHDGRP